MTLATNIDPDEVLEEECEHNDREYQEGNYIAPFGWEQYPGWYCWDCEEMIPEEDIYYG